MESTLTNHTAPEKMVKQKHRFVLYGFTVILLAVAISYLHVGAIKVPVKDVWNLIYKALILENIQELPFSYVLAHIRVPRMLLGILVGGSLAICGASIQGLFRNPLADPGLIGTTSGAALFASLTIVFAAEISSVLPDFLKPVMIYIAAFSGAVITTLLVYRLSHHQGKVSIATMLLAGMAISAIVGAALGLLQYLSDEDELRSLTFWSMGSLSGGKWDWSLAIAAPTLLFSVFKLSRLSRTLNALLLGEAEAVHMGIDLNRIKTEIIVWVALSVSICVSLTGGIGFVGLVVPHLIRLMFGPDHRLLLPASFLLGAIILLLSDLLSRTVAIPAEIPIGIITATIGGPFFLWMIIKFKAKLI